MCSDASRSLERSTIDDEVQLFDIDVDAFTDVVVDCDGGGGGTVASKSSSKMLDDRMFLTTSDLLCSSVRPSHCGCSRWMVPLWMCQK